MIKEIIHKIRKLKSYYEEGKIPTLAVHEVHPDLPRNSRLNYIYFTLPVSLNFQRSSPAMWKSALETYNDEETNFLFYPEITAKKNFEDIQFALLKHKLGLQRIKHTQIWSMLSNTIYNDYESNPENILKDCQYNVGQVIQLLQKEKKKAFPYLSGAKMTNYWLYILLKYTDVKLNEINRISIIPDTHVLQCSVKLGITNEKDSPEIVSERWFKLLQNTDIAPVEMHPVLWNWSRNNFIPEI